MTFWGIAPDGGRRLLGEPAECVLSQDQDAPADLLRAVFPAERLWEPLAEVEGALNGAVFFRGVVDEQTAALSAAGLTVELVCRGREALLLDNEAPPGTLLSPDLNALEERLLRPLGLSLGVAAEGRWPGEFPIAKGKSCWWALAAFCQGVFGETPYVDLAGQVRLGGPGGGVALGEPLSAKLSYLPYQRISEVWVQSFRGTYDTRYRGPGAGVPRRRYLSQRGGDPKALLEQGERASFLLTVTVAGALWPGKGGRASVTVPGMGRFQDCPVKSAQVRRDKTGERTKFVLERGEGPCG